MSAAEALDAALKSLAAQIDGADLDPDPARPDWTRRQDEVGTVRRALDQLLGQVDPALEDLTEPAHKERLKAAVAEIASEAAALVWASGDRTGAYRPLERAERLCPAGPRREEIASARTDFESFVGLIRMRWLWRSARQAESRKLARALLRSAQAPVLREAARRIAEAPEPMRRAPTLFTINGVGVRLYGERDRRDDGSYVATTCFSVLFVPLVPLASYRVIPQGGNRYLFVSRERLSPFARGWRWVVSLGALVLALGFAGSSYWRSPSRRVSRALDAAARLERTGRAEAAVAAYDEAIRTYANQVDGERLEPAAVGIVRILGRAVHEPFAPNAIDQAVRLRDRFDAMPAQARSGRAAAYLAELLARWAMQVGETPQAPIGRAEVALRLLDLAEPIADGSAHATLVARRRTVRLAVARGLANEWPRDALAQYAILGDDPDALAGAGEVIGSLGDDLSLWAEAAPQVEAWMGQAASDPARGPAIASARQRLESARAQAADPERRRILDAHGEAALRAWMRRKPHDQRVAQALAEIQRGRGDLAGATATLAALGPPGRLADDALVLLGTLYAETDRLEDADRLLSRFVATRMVAYRDARQAYFAEGQSLEHRVVERARTGDVPADLRSRLDAVGEEEAGRLLRQWLAEQVERDPRLGELRARFERYADVIPASLTLGMVELRRATAAAGERRRALLGEAERILVSIQQDAQGDPSFHLGLGQVYHRLGRAADGERELSLVLARHEPMLRLGVMRAYRDLGLLARARELGEDIYRNDGSPWKEGAAIALAVMTGDLDERERWLRRADQSSFEVQNNLREVEAERLVQSGNFGAAAETYARAATEWMNTAPNSATGANNAAVAYMSRYRCTGDPDDLRQAARALDNATRLEPDSSLVLENYAQLLSYLGTVEVLDRWFHTRVLRPSDTDAYLLLRMLSQGDRRTDVVAALRADSTLRRSVELTRRAEVLAPSNAALYAMELSRHREAEDLTALRDLARRVEGVTELDTSRDAEDRERYEQGRDDDKRSRDLQAAFDRLERVRSEVVRDGHGPTIAALDLLRSGYLNARVQMAGRPEDAREALEAARRGQPGLRTNGWLAWLLFENAVLGVAASTPALAEAVRRDLRVFALDGLLYRMVLAHEQPAILAALRRRTELREAVEIDRAEVRLDPGFDDWVLARTAGDADLEHAAAAVFDREDVRLGLEIRTRLYPTSRDVVLTLAVVRRRGR